MNSLDVLSLLLSRDVINHLIEVKTICSISCFKYYTIISRYLDRIELHKFYLYFDSEDVIIYSLVNPYCSCRKELYSLIGKSDYFLFCLKDFPEFICNSPVIISGFYLFRFSLKNKNEIDIYKEKFRSLVIKNMPDFIWK